MHKHQIHTQRQLRETLSRRDRAVTDKELEQEMARMPSMIVNPCRRADDLRDEADMRLWAARELLRDMGASNGDIQTEGYQAACTAAALLLDDVEALTDSAGIIERAEEAGA